MFSGAIDNVAVVAEEEEGDHPKMMESLKDPGLCRKEKRKMAKKMKRKQIRKEIAEKEREEEESRLNDLEEQHRLKLKEQEEADIMERQRKEFEERERLWMEKAAKLAEEEAQRKIQEEEEKAQRKQIENENDLDEDDTWEYVEDGPAEIIWQGNEIIVKKKRVRVAKKNAEEQLCIEDADRPTSNPLPPQSEAFATYKNTSAASTQQVFDSVAQQIPNFGTEQDKAHCPFHIKTGACRFGSRCSRVHFYPDKSCTLLIKNMYNGPGLAWEQDEGLEFVGTPCILGEGGVLLFQAITSKGLNLQHTDEEVERCYEEFYEDVHTEFLKFGEIVNFKVCRNGSFHLRGNVYVHYKFLESAVLAYQSLNGRYFAGKQITCEFVGVTRWKVAICGEYMKSRLKTCSRGTACNFIHCFRNPGGDYEWADWDNPPPKYWIEKMVALFGPSDVSEYDKNMETRSRRKLENNKKITSKFSRYPSRRSISSVADYLTSSSGGEHSDGNRNHQHSHSSRHKCSSSSSSRKKRSLLDEQQRYEENSSSEDDRYRYNEKDIALHSHSDRDRISSSSRETSSHWRKGMDFLDGHENLKERHRSSASRLYSHDSSRKYSSRRKHSSGQIKEGNYEHMKQDEDYLADSHGRYDPNSGHNSDIEQRDNSETNNCFSEHEKYRSTSPDDRKPHDGRFKSQEEISDLNHNKKRSRHSKQNNHRKHSNSREEKADSSDKDQSCEEKHQSSSVNIASHDQSREGKNVLNKERTSSKTTKGRLNLEKTGEHVKNMVESPEDIHRSRRHGRSSRRERHHREKAINRYDKTSISGVNDLEQKGSRKRSRSRSPIQSSSRSKREISHGSYES